MIASSIVIYLELGFPIVWPVYPGIASRAAQDGRETLLQLTSFIFIISEELIEMFISHFLIMNLLYDIYASSEKKFN
ncbi:MAG: hypothetical protein AB4352_12855 [Hormoscilla sp.]